MAAKMDTRKLEKVTRPIIERAKSFMIMSHDDYVKLFDYTKENKAAQKKVKAYFKGARESTHKAWLETKALEDGFLNPLIESEKIAKTKMTAWNDEQERKQQEEEARLQAKADADAEKERQRLLKRAEKLKTPELKEEAYEAAQDVQAPIVHVKKAPKVDGLSYVKKWKVDFENIDLLRLIASAAGGDKLALSFLTYNKKALSDFATSSKGKIPVSGVPFYEDKSSRIR